jgi:hypothetical protein
MMVSVRNVSYNKTFRKNITQEVIDPETIESKNIIPAQMKKDEALQKFIENIPKCRADHHDYLTFMFSFIFSQPENCYMILREQKYYMKYLCSNDSTCFSKKITRGQIKLWTIIYYMAHHELPKDFKTLTDWIIHEKNYQKYEIQSEKTSFEKDLLASKSYFDTIHELDDGVILGKKGYSSSFFKKNEMEPGRIPKERYQGPNGFRNLMGDNMFDLEKIAALKKKWKK